MEGKTAEDSGEISCDEESYANRLKFVQLKPDCLDGHSVNEWTVIYSDSNSSIMSDLNDEDNDDNVDGVRTDNNNLIDDEKVCNFVLLLLTLILIFILFSRLKFLMLISHCQPIVLMQKLKIIQI